MIRSIFYLVKVGNGKRVIVCSVLPLETVITEMLNTFRARNNW